MYQIIYTPEAEYDLDELDKTIKEQTVKKTEWLGENAAFIFHHQLSSLPDELKNLCRVRVGDWRILYWVYHDRETIKIYGIKHRSSAYKKI